MVTFAMPPMFCRARHRVPLNSIASAMGTSGAPCPPAATSRLRKSEITASPVRSAMTAAFPICQVAAPGACHRVCPWLATAAISLRGTPASAIAAIAASASHSPSATSSAAYSAAVAPAIARSTRARCALVYGRCTKASSSASTGVPPTRATAALTPSRLVPDISPTTTAGASGASRSLTRPGARPR